MSEPFLAEIKIVGFNFAPRGWALCDGQILPINQNQSLFSLLGTTYGGDGRTTFALPDLRGRTPIHKANGYHLGQRAGTEEVTLSTLEIPTHTHTVNASTGLPNVETAAGNFWAASAANPYTTAAGSSTLHNAVQNTGGQAHENMQPYLALHFVIALQGTFPSRN